MVFRRFWRKFKKHDKLYQRVQVGTARFDIFRKVLSIQLDVERYKRFSQWNKISDERAHC